MLAHKWTSSRGECIGGDGESLVLIYHIFRDDIEVLQFEVSVYEKGSRIEEPVSIIIDPTNLLNVEIRVSSWYDKKTYITRNAGNTWI